MQYIPIITLVLVVILLGLVIVLLTRKPEKPELPQQIDPTASITAFGTLVTQNLREGREAQEQSAFRDGQEPGRQNERSDRSARPV